MNFDWVGPPGSGTAATTVIELALEGCAREPDTPALIFDDGAVITRGQVREQAEAFAGYLAEHVGPGERFAAMIGNRAEMMIAWLAGAISRSVFVPVSDRAGASDLAHVIEASGARLLVSARPVQAAVPVVVLEGGEPYGLPGGVPLGLEDSAAVADDIAGIFFTSGTTGKPKGCMLDHRAWLALIDISLRVAPGATQRILCPLQFHYPDSTILFLCQFAADGSSLVVTRRFSVSRFWEIVRRERVTVVQTLASMAPMLLKAPRSDADRDNTVQLAWHNAVPAALHAELNERWGFPWIETYGITEAGALIGTPLPYASELVGSGALGLPYPQVETRLVDARGEAVADGEVGELLVRAPGMFRGYLNDPEATAAVLSEDGWFATGDLLRRDERGLYYFEGRKKELIRRMAENIAPAEVEDVLRALPQVLDAAVIPVPDELRGEEVKAYVQLVEGAQLPPETIIAHCLEQLAPFKVPRYIEYRVEPFPRTPTMRVRKEDLKAERADLLEGVWDREAA
jgi:crotonobetaine/carnitine-CoA ligase